MTATGSGAIRFFITLCIIGSIGSYSLAVTLIVGTPVSSIGNHVSSLTTMRDSCMTIHARSAFMLKAASFTDKMQTRTTHSSTPESGVSTQIMTSIA